MVAPSAGKAMLVSSDLGLALQQRRGLDDALDHREHARLRLLQVVRDAVALGKAATEEQDHHQHDDGRERGLAALLDRAKHKLGIFQFAVFVELKREPQELALSFEQHERLASLGITQDRFDECDRISAPMFDRHRHDCGSRR